MILFQILALILLVPLTVAMLIIFNVYLLQWFYLLLIVCFALLYSFLCGLVFFHFNTAVCVFMILVVLYIARMSYLSYTIKDDNQDNRYPSLRGKIKAKICPFLLVFVFPLSFLRVFKLLPDAVNRKFRKKIGMDITMSAFVDLIVNSGRGMCVEIARDGTEIFLEIK